MEKEEVSQHECILTVLSREDVARNAASAPHATPVTALLCALPRLAISVSSLAVRIVTEPPVLQPPHTARYCADQS